MSELKGWSAEMEKRAQEMRSDPNGYAKRAREAAQRGASTRSTSLTASAPPQQRDRKSDR